LGSLLLSLALLLFFGCASEPAPGPQAAAPAGPSFGIDPLVSINAVMVGLVDHSAHQIWDLGREGAAPETDHEWMEVEHHAIQLAAGASWIATGGTGEPDAGWVRQGTWSEWATGVNEGAIAALEAARLKDLPAVLTAGDEIIEACEGCHKEFKPDLPTEGIMHPHIYEPRT
jgi:hypothetical protein